jgi:DNA-binding CsgD family transcriptional regulator
MRRVERLSEAATDARQYRAAVMGEIHRVVPHDAYAWLLTDPVTGVGCDPLAEVPFFAELPHAVKLKYATTANRWTHLYAAGESVGLLSEGDTARSPMWSQLLSRFGIGDAASVVFADRFGIWGWLDLWRSDSFTATEASHLSQLAVPITRTLRAQRAATLVTPAAPDRRLGPVVMVHDDGLHLQSQTPASEEWLRLLLPPPAGESVVPAAAYNVAAQVIANEAKVDTNAPMTRMHLSDGVWVTLRAARLTSANQGGSIAVTIEESSAAERIEVFARAFGLSRRETELLETLPNAVDGSDLARRLYISEYTVQDHLKSIFAKTGAHNRQTLLARAAGR